MFKGIDVGNGYTKFDKRKFASRVKIGEKINFGKQKSEVHYISYEGTSYIIGEGSIFTGDSRYFTKEYELCLLTALALSAEKENLKGVIEADIVIGLPEKKHKLISEKLEQHLKKLGLKTILVDEKEYRIKISEVIVFIEGAYPIKTEEEENILVIDNGAGTINVTQWEELSIINSAIYNESMYKMYADIASYLNSNKGADFKPTDIEKMLNKSTTIINQEEVDITDIRPIITNHIKEIASYIRNDFKVKDAAKIYIIGGGGYDTFAYWEKEFPKIQIVENSQSVNSEIYNAIAESEFTNE